MNVAIYLHPSRAKPTDRDEDYLISSPPLHELLDRKEKGDEGILIPAPELCRLVQSAEGEVAHHLRDALNHLEEAHMVLLVRRNEA